MLRTQLLNPVRKTDPPLADRKGWFGKMPSLMRYINVVSRCGASFRGAKLADTDLGDTHHSYILAVCHNPGISQDKLARKLFINKSNVTRNLAYLENHGYVTRRQSDEDRRVICVYPTQKALDALPGIRAILREWNGYITEGFTEEEMATFLSMMKRVSERAAELVQISADLDPDPDTDVSVPDSTGN